MNLPFPRTWHGRASSARGMEESMAENPVGIAIVGIGMWCKALATVMEKSGAFRMVTCFTRTKAKREEFAAAFHCDQDNSTKMS